MNQKLKVENANKTPTQLANQFAQGVYGLSLPDFAKKIIDEIRAEKAVSCGDAN